MLVVIGGICLFSMYYFGKIRAIQDAESIRAKAAADAHRAGATAAVAHQVANPVAHAEHTDLA